MSLPPYPTFGLGVPATGLDQQTFEMESQNFCNFLLYFDIQKGFRCSPPCNMLGEYL